jgi:hypothetical protein
MEAVSSSETAMTFYMAIRCHISHDITLKYGVLTAVVMNSSIFWDTTSCSPLKLNRRFGGTCLLNVQVRRMAQEESDKQSHPLGLFFDLEDVGDMFHRNIG